LINKHYLSSSPGLKPIPIKKFFKSNLFLPSFWISTISKDLSLQPIVKLLSRIVPGKPVFKAILACHILYLTFLYINHAPGFGLSPLIFANIILALSFQFI